MRSRKQTAGSLRLAGGAEQAAPLGRAVIDGLLMAKFATLTILPLFYAILQSGVRRYGRSLDPNHPEESLP